MIKSIRPFGNSLSKALLERHAEFTNLVELTYEVAAQNPQGLIDVVRLYMRPLKTDFILSCAQRPLHGTMSAIAPHDLFMLGARMELTDHWSYPKLDAGKFVVNLSRDPVLPCPWRRDRYVSALASIGIGKESGAWEQDRDHSGALLLP